MAKFTPSALMDNLGIPLRGSLFENAKHAVLAPADVPVSVLPPLFHSIAFPLAMNSLPYPESITKLDGHAIRIAWSDGTSRRYTAGQLRKACPCATCREKRMAEADRPKASLAILSEKEAVVLDVVQMKPVGNYAYNLVFSDGHSSGLFTIEFLRQIGTPEPTSGSDGLEAPGGPS
ncbi:MAG: DUF971 domain-containing protein [Pirellula sp.]